MKLKKNFFCFESFKSFVSMESVLAVVIETNGLKVEKFSINLALYLNERT
jgi:hypothetical protein